MSPKRVSFDGKWIAGDAVDEAGEVALAVFAIGTDEVYLPRREDGRFFRKEGDVAWAYAPGPPACGR